jgi:hypothetical protein
MRNFTSPKLSRSKKSTRNVGRDNFTFESSSSSLSTTLKSSKAPITSIANSMNDRQSILSSVCGHPGWQEWRFVIGFITAAGMGSILNYSIFLCTTLNSALTTAVIGCLKNVATTYIGMMVFPDYEFSFLNFIGLNISIIGSLYYTYITMVKGMQGFGGG